MIIITSEVTFTADKWDEALELAKSHVEKSRLETGCKSHRYLISPEHEHCLFFYEEWVDRAAIDFHFAQPYSRHLSKMFQLWATNQIKINFHHVREKEAQSPETDS